MRRVEPSSNQSTTWSDEAFEATEFLFADYRDFVFPAHMHETFAIGVIEAGGQRFRPGRAPALVMPAGTLCAINPGVVHEGLPATEQGWRYRMFYPSPALVASKLEDSQRGPVSGDWGLGQHVIDDRELYRKFLSLHVSSQFKETLLERQTRIEEFLRRLFERHGNFSPERNQMHVAPRTVARVRDYLHSMHQHQISIADLAQAAGVSRYAGYSGLLRGNRHAAACLSRQPAGRTGKGVASRRTLCGRGGAGDRFLRSKSADPSLQTTHRSDARHGSPLKRQRRAGKESTRFRAVHRRNLRCSKACTKSI